MFRKSYLPELVLFVLSISLITGCYTVISHQKNLVFPGASDAGVVSENDPHSIDISNNNSCVSCHLNEPGFNALHASGMTFGSSSLWAYYYDTSIPWWVSRNSNEAEEVGEAGDTGMRRYYGRRREALNNNNAGSSITINTEAVSGRSTVIPSFSPSAPIFGGAITTIVMSTDSVTTQTTDSIQNGQTTDKTEPLKSKRDFGVRKNVKKK